MGAEKGFSSVLALVLAAALLLGFVAFIGISPGQALGLGTPENVFYIVVNDNIYSPLENYLERYAQDLEAEGFTVETYLWTWGTPEDVRAFLQGASGLVGALLVGDIPAAWYYDDVWPAENYPTDLFYMDLDGIWVDTDDDGVYDNHTGDREPEIYIGRLKASGMSEDEVSLLQNYFDKNHAYRTGTLTLPRRALIYLDDDFAHVGRVFDSAISSIYADRTLENDPDTTSGDDYLSRLREGWSLIHLGAHGWSGGHGFYAGGAWQNVDFSDIRATDPHAFFYNLYSCETARYVEGDYIGGWYIFSDTYGLAVIGPTGKGGMGGGAKPYNFYPRLRDERLGTAFQGWLSSHDTIIRDMKDMVILGDPTLYLPVAWSQPEVSISPSYQSGPPGATLNYTVTVTNEGNIEDTFILSASDTMGWLSMETQIYPSEDVYAWDDVPEVWWRSPQFKFDISSITGDILSARLWAYTHPLSGSWDGSGYVMRVDDQTWDEAITESDFDSQTVTDSEPFTDKWLTEGEWDNVDVTKQIQAESGENFTVRLSEITSGWNTVMIYDYGPDGTLMLGHYSASIQIYSSEGAHPPYLEVSYCPISPSILTIPPGESRQATLTVTIPEDVELGAVDNITVTATSQADPSVSDSASCIARAVPPWAGTATFKLENLYKVGLEKDLQLNTGSKLVVKFYKYDNITLQAESIIDEFAPPHYVEENEKVPHPSGLPVEIATLVLTTDNTEEVISTIASFTVDKLDLEIRLSDIPSEWALAPTPEEKLQLEIEFSQIPVRWALAPS